MIISPCRIYICWNPINPNKKVIVLVHGLASSPEAWIRLTNDIMGDPVLREHFQVWQVFYSTNMPIIESRFQIYALLNQTFAQVDPKAAAKKDAVLVGHLAWAALLPDY